VVVPIYANVGMILLANRKKTPLKQLNKMVTKALIINNFYFIYKIGEKNIEVVDDGTPESMAAIKSGVVRVILDENKNVKYPPLRQD
jgi:hypothetical protein